MSDTSILAAIKNCLELDSKVVAFECSSPSLDNVLGQIEQDFVGRVRICNGAVQGVTGLAFGAAIAGLKPILKFNSPIHFIESFQFFSDVVTKLPIISSANLDAPLVTLCPSGPGLPWGVEHDNALESLISKIEGLSCFFATDDISELLNEALAEEKPTIILYSPLDSDLEDISNYCGKDLAVIAWGHNYKRAQSIAKKLRDECNYELTVLNLKQIYPLNKEEILKVVSHTHRVVVISDGSQTSSYGNEIASFIQKEALDELDAPVLTIPFWHTAMRYLPSFTEYDEKFTRYCFDTIKDLLSDKY